MPALFRIVRSTSTLWPLYVGVALTAIVTALLSLASPFIFKEATDLIVDATTNGFDAASLSRSVLLLAGLIFAADLARTLVSNLGGYIGDMMAARMKTILSTRYFAQLLALPQRFFDTNITGTLIARLDRSITSVTQFAQTFSNNLFTSLITVVATLGIMAYYYWPLAILIAILFPLYLWLTALTSKRWQKIEAVKNRHVDAAGGRFAEVVSQVKVTKSFVAETRELDQFGKHYGSTVELTREQSAFWHRMDSLRGGAMNLIFLGIYALLFYRTLHGYFSIGVLVMLLQLVNMARQPVYMMSWIVDSAQRAIAGSKDYFSIMAEDVEATANHELIKARTMSEVPDIQLQTVDPLVPLPEQPAIDFSHVTFAYEQGKPVLEDVTFQVARGEKIALVGESGGGKSTVVNLLLGLYSPQGGTLRVGGHDASTVDSESLRASVGVVFQEPYLFSGSVAENIAYGRPTATREEIQQVAKRANAHGFITAFPDGYDTVIGERGLRLSGGQKQRIAVARAMLKDAPILLLDEATSALDNRAEKAVQEGLNELMRGRTTVIIAHRLSTIADVDRIVTLAEGRVDEVGTPAQLATSGGIYAQLLQLTASSSLVDRKRLKEFGLEDPFASEDDPAELA